MSAISKIQWTDRTWNPVRGCSIVSPGCVNCYAMKQAHRFSGPFRAYEGLTKQTKAGPQWTGKVALVESALSDPLGWLKPQRIFVNSMSDLFHDAAPFEFIDRVFAMMACAPQHTFQILTKRPERMLRYVSGEGLVGGSAGRTTRIHEAAKAVLGFDSPRRRAVNASDWPLRNVWLGVSCEDQPRADERIPLLLQTPAAVRFVSAEPLLGPINLDQVWRSEHDVFLDSLGGGHVSKPGEYVASASWPKDIDIETRLDWVIVGGESGPGARMCSQQWIRSIVQQCQSVSVPVFVKQLGKLSAYGEPGVNGGFRPTDRKGGDPSEWPDDLRVREFPV